MQSLFLFQIAKELRVKNYFVHPVKILELQQGKLSGNVYTLLSDPFQTFLLSLFM